MLQTELNIVDVYLSLKYSQLINSAAVNEMLLKSIFIGKCGARESSGSLKKIIAASWTNINQTGQRAIECESDSSKRSDVEMKDKTTPEYEIVSIN